MARIDAVTFDLWDTLIQEVPGGSAAVARLRLEGMDELLRASGVTRTREELERAYGRTGEFLESVWGRDEDISVDEQVEFFLESLDRGLASTVSSAARADFTKIYAESMLRHGPVLFPGAAPALSAVRKLCPCTGLISNTGKTPGSVIRVLLRRMGIFDMFRVAVFSDEVRARKPDRRIFHRALTELGVDPERTVHIGDNPWADIDGAKEIGMMAVQIGGVNATGVHRADAYVESLDKLAPAILELERR